MEHINRIEIQGIVGRATRMHTGQDVTVRFSVACNRFYRDAEGNAVCETTWFGICATKSVTPAADLVEKGKTVNVRGRLVMRRCTDAEGTDRVIPEVVATEITLIGD